jgi:hypothetical protein
MNKNNILFDLEGNLMGSRDRFDSTTLSSYLVGLNNYIDLDNAVSSDYLSEQSSSFLNSSACCCFHFHTKQDNNRDNK